MLLPCFLSTKKFEDWGRLGPLEYRGKVSLFVLTYFCSAQAWLLSAGAGECGTVCCVTSEDRFSNCYQVGLVRIKAKCSSKGIRNSSCCQHALI